MLALPVVMSHACSALMAEGAVLAAVPLAFVSVWVSVTLYVVVSLIWIVPDRRVEKAQGD